MTTRRRSARRTNAPTAIPACIRYISGSSGLRRMARAKCSMAPSGSPRQTRRKPPRNQAAARFGLSTSALSIKRDAAIEIAGEMAERMTASRERDRIVPAQLDRPPRQPGALGDLLRRDRSSSR